MGIFIILLLVIILLVFFGPLGAILETMSDKSTIATRDAGIQQAISTVYTSGGRYSNYLSMAKSGSPPLTPWQFERLMNLAKKKMLTPSNIDIIMGL